MSRKVLLQLVLPLIGLSVLFWLLAFAPGDKHYQPALLEMSVILRDGDGNVSAMRKGMEQAAKDLNVELPRRRTTVPLNRCSCWNMRCRERLRLFCWYRRTGRRWARRYPPLRGRRPL